MQTKTKMKHLLAGVAALGVCAAVALSAGSVKAADDDLAVEAVIVAAITVDCSTQDLNFGAIAASTAGGANVVTVDTAGLRSIAGAGNGSLVGADETEGQCTVTGTATYDVDITLPASTVVSGPGPDMTVNNFTVDTPDGPGLAFELTGGADIISIGADLTVAQGQTAGAYSGVLNVEVNYQ